MAQADWLGPKVGSCLALVLYFLSVEPGELSQWLRHDDSTINIVIHCYQLSAYLLHDSSSSDLLIVRYYYCYHVTNMIGFRGS